MKQSSKAVKAATYVTGILAIGSAMLLALLLALSVIGLIHPRTQKIILQTPSISKVYDGLPMEGGVPVLLYGSLHPGHTMQVQSRSVHTLVGEYENIPQTVIVDETGADVTGQYDIQWDIGKMSISPRPIILSSRSKVKVYDGEPLTADDAALTGGTLAEGHTLVTEGANAVLLPGAAQVEPVYRIVAGDGSDATQQYQIHKDFGQLEVLRIPLTVATETANKTYDGKPFSASGWEHIGGTLLPGHTLDMRMLSVLSDAGSISNEGQAVITDESGADQSMLYDVQYRFGTLRIDPLPLYITTQSAQKIYDGTPLVCEDWTLISGDLEPGAVLTPVEFASNSSAGTVDNAIRFHVTDAAGRDITHRYSIVCDYGTLSVQPRAITIRTGSAQKVYDGSPLSCHDFEIIDGSLCDGEQISIVCNAIMDVGYSDNYVLDCAIYRLAGDHAIEVTACYRITFDFGTLKITAA